MPLPDEQLLQELAGALERHMKQRGLLIPFMLGCILTLACLAVGYFAWRRLERQREGLEAAAYMASASDADLQRLLRDALPTWVLVPDSARVEWLNTLTKQLWPFVERGAVKFLMKDKLLDSLLNTTTFWRPRVLADAELHVEPPRITGVKTFPQHGGQNEVLQEYNFVWSSKMEVKLLVKLLGKRQGSKAQSLLSNVARLKVGVSNLVARGTLRIALKPLLDEIPIAGGIKVSFMGCPDFSYSTRVLGGNPYFVPGIKHLIDSFIKDRLLMPLNYPDGFTYDLVTHSTGAQQERPEGLLEVTVVQAMHVPRMDAGPFGKCDPYCQCWVRESHKVRTTVKSRTLKPRWNETFTFMCHSTQYQDLTLALYDADFWSEDDLVGCVKVPLASLNLVPGVVNELWLPVPRAGKDSYGEEEGSDERVHTIRVAGGSGAAFDEQDLTSFSAVTAREDTAARVLSSNGPTSLPRLLSSPIAAASPTAAASSRAASPAVRLRSSRSPACPAALPKSQSNASSSMATVWSQELRKLAVNPLELLRTKRCIVHITATYFPLTDMEIAAAARDAGRQQRGEVEAASSSRLPGSIPRVASMLRSGILYVWLERANNLKAKAGFTRNIKISVRVHNTKKTTERANIKLQQRANPVFEEMVELIVDSDTAQKSNTLIHVDILMEHLIRRPSFQGRVSIPLKDVIERRRVRDTWALQDAQQGTITMELSWLSALSM